MDSQYSPGWLASVAAAVALGIACGDDGSAVASTEAATASRPDSRACGRLRPLCSARPSRLSECQIHNGHRKNSCQPKRRLGDSCVVSRSRTARGASSLAWLLVASTGGADADEPGMTSPGIGSAGPGTAKAPNPGARGGSDGFVGVCDRCRIGAGVAFPEREDRLPVRWARLVGTMVLLVLTTCRPSVFYCETDDACSSGNQSGICVLPSGYCAFPNQRCDSGFAYGEFVPESLSGGCVELGGTGSVGSESESDSGTTGSSSGAASRAIGTGAGSSTDSTGAPVGCVPGQPCIPSDLCASQGVCDDRGVCAATEQQRCESPPSMCHAALGSCVDGECFYGSLPLGAPCEDGDGCTVADSCDGHGVCVPGAVCPVPGPCRVSSCEKGVCMEVPAEDGVSCGRASSARCCSGRCVDISADPAHCGGCDTACATGFACEAIDVTTTCKDAVPEVSGRCRCQGANLQCPRAQVCRTSSPYSDRCAPQSDANCHGSAVDQSGCPSFCSYD